VTVPDCDECETLPAPPELPSAGESPSGLWLLAGLFVAVPLVLIAVLSAVLRWHWLPSLWWGYGWPSDKGNGPEALQQTIAYALIAAVFVPPVRHFIALEFHKVHLKVDAVHQTVKDHVEERKAADEELHAHLHHLSDRMNLPRFERKESPHD
jgi:hypothetical protein